MAFTLFGERLAHGTEHAWRHARPTPSVIGEYRLEESPVFADCPEKEMAVFEILASYTEVPVGRTIMRQGGFGSQFVVVLQGVARVVRDGADIDEAGSGTVLGEMALLEDAPRTATVVAATPMAVLVSNPGEFRSMMRTCPTLQQRVESVAASRRHHIAAVA